MAETQQIPGNTDIAGEAAPPRRYSAAVEFADEETDRKSGPTSVDIYAVGNKWYCRVRCGGRRTRPMGPYSRQQAERIQDMRRQLIAKRGTARLVFE